MKCEMNCRKGKQKNQWGKVRNNPKDEATNGKSKATMEDPNI